MTGSGHALGFLGTDELDYIPLRRSLLLRLANRVPELSGIEPFAGDFDLHQLLQAVSSRAEVLALDGQLRDPPESSAFSTATSSPTHPPPSRWHAGLCEGVD